MLLLSHMNDLCDLNYEFLSYHQFQLHHGNVMYVLLGATFTGTIGLALAAISCELGQRLSDAFDDISSAVNLFDWYLFPIQIQRMLPLIIPSTQQPVALACFGSIVCTRDALRKVFVGSIKFTNTMVNSNGLKFHSF